MSAFAALLREAPAAWPSALPDHLSASQLTMFSRCPEQYRRRYVLGQKERPGGALVWGSADHYAHEQNFRQKIETGTDLPVDDVKVAFAEGFDQAVERGGGETEVVWGDDKPAQLKDAGVQLVAVYHETVSPTVQPVAVEEKFEVAVPGVPVPVIGYMDVRTGAAGVERKTAKAKPANGEPKPDWRFQGRLYQAVASLPVEWHVSVKTRVPAVYVPEPGNGLRLELSDIRVRTTLTQVRSIVRGLLATWWEFGPDEAWPDAVTHPWACDFCGWGPRGNGSCAWWAS